MVILFSSCSLNYVNEENSEDTTPEFIFNKAVFNRYKSNRQSLFISADKIEQYKTGDYSYAKTANFRTFDKKGVLETEGRCELLSADSKNENYYLFGNIELSLVKDKTTLNAECLNFDKKSEQITSGSENKVSVSKDDLEVSGVGFSASGISRSFSFMSDVSGTIYDK